MISQSTQRGGVSHLVVFEGSQLIVGRGADCYSVPVDCLSCLFAMVSVWSLRKQRQRAARERVKLYVLELEKEVVSRGGDIDDIKHKFKIKDSQCA